MRSLCCPLFCILAVFFFVLYLTRTHIPHPDENLLLSLVLTGFISAIFYWLYGIVRRWRPNPLLWRIIYGLIGFLFLLIIISVPELRQIIEGWIEGATIKDQNLIVYSIICLIICVVCCTRPARSTS